MKKTLLLLLAVCGVFCSLFAEIQLTPDSPAGDTISLQRKEIQHYFENPATRFKYRHLKSKGRDNDSGRMRVVSIRPEKSAVKLELSNSEDFKVSSVYTLADGKISLPSLRPNKTYFWRGIDAQGKKLPVHSFKTLDTVPYWVAIPGIWNFRDLGNWKSAHFGKRVKYGMVYRGTESDDRFKIKPEGLKILLEELKIKTDLDLRGSRLSKAKGFVSIFEGKIRRCHIPVSAYEAMMPTGKAPYMSKKVYPAIFKEMADKNNYPFYIHCFGGADRTGTVMFFLECILGFSDADLAAEFEMTSFSCIGLRDSQKKADKNCYPVMLKALAPYGPKDGPIWQKGVAFLKSCGVTDEDMSKIRAILLE